MGNSNKKLQSVVDYACTIPALNPVLRTGGFAQQPALEIANDVMTDILSQRFNWKFNRVVIPPFYTISNQQDYVSTAKNIGWLEHCCIVDINNSALPKPIYWVECVRDLERTSFQAGRIAKIAWLPNDQLFQDVWPGAGKTYTNPLGAVIAPTNPPTNIVDANGNILRLTTYGITAVNPVAAQNAAAGVNVNDGTCVWTVVDPKAQGFRLTPMPSQQGVVYQVNPFAQARPVQFTTLSQTLDPIPDDYAKYFREGFIAYCHRHSASPAVQAKFEEMRRNWYQALAEARGAGDRERDDAGFVLENTVMGGSTGAAPITASWPFAPR
jgi:hypothetical protein